MSSIEEGKMKVFEYPNATSVKSNNRRVVVEELDNEDKDIGLCFKILCSKEDAAIPSAHHRVIKDRLKITSIRISEKAAISLYIALGRQLSIRNQKRYNSLTSKTEDNG